MCNKFEDKTLYVMTGIVADKDLILQKSSEKTGAAP